MTLDNGFGVQNRKAREGKEDPQESCHAGTTLVHGITFPVPRKPPSDQAGRNGTTLLNVSRNLCPAARALCNIVYTPLEK